MAREPCFHLGDLDVPILPVVALDDGSHMEGARLEVEVGASAHPPLTSRGCFRTQSNHASTLRRRQSSGIPLREWTPRSSKVMPDPTTRSLTVLDTRT